MGVGSFDLSGGQFPLAYQAQRPGVFLFNPDAEKPFSLLPNVVVMRIEERVGPNPHVAYFRYLADDAYNAALGWPSRVEDMWPLDAQGPYVVRADDRLCVATQNPDGTPLFLFDGFAQIPQADLAGQSEQVTFTAISVAAREFDNPISGRTQRSSALPVDEALGIQDTTGESDIGIDLPCRFNPTTDDVGDEGGFDANKTPFNFDTKPQQDDEGNTTRPGSPVFVDTDAGNDEGRPGDESADYWSISDAIKYILATENPTSKYTDYPALSTLDDLIATYYAQDDTGPIQPGDILSDPLLLRDYNAANKPWPEAVAELLGYAGFVMRWDLETGLDGLPQTIMRIYRRDMLSSAPVKQVFLDEVGNSLAQGSPNNVLRMHLARDTNNVVNAWQVETDQKQVEVSVYLVPLYKISADDASSGNRTKYDEAALTQNNADAPTRRKYRWYGVDELGDGFWEVGANQWQTGQPFKFDTVFPPDDDGTPSYAVRYRPGLGHLVTKDSRGNPLKAQLDVAFGVFTGDGAAAFAKADDFPDVKWFNIPGGWRLLKDRLGIEVTAQKLEEWNCSNKDVNGGKINGVSWWASPPTAYPAKGAPSGGWPSNGYPPLLRLTVVIEDDLRMPISVNKRVGSPTQFARWRVADGRDHFQYTSIDLSSANYQSAGGDGKDAVVVRDDTKAATSHARTLQRAHEMPPLAGSITFVGTAYSYEIGDRIQQVIGRDINLYANVGQSQGEAPTFPIVVARSFTFDPHQYTEIHLSDERAMYHARRHRVSEEHNNNDF